MSALFLRCKAVATDRFKARVASIRSGSAEAEDTVLARNETADTSMRTGRLAAFESSPVL